MTMTRRRFLGHVAASPLIPVAADLSRRSGEAAKADHLPAFAHAYETPSVSFGLGKPTYEACHAVAA